MRKLAWLCGGIAVAIVLSEYVLSSGVMLWFGAAALIGAGIFLAWKREKRILPALLCFGLALGFFRSWSHYQLVIRPAEERNDREAIVHARVVEYPDVYDTAEYVMIRLDDGFGGIKCRLTSYDGGLAELEPGDEIVVNVLFRSARYRYGEETERFTSKGVFLLGTCREIPTKTGTWKYSFLYYPHALARAVAEQCRHIFSSDTAPFMTALLTGDKKDLYSDEITYSNVTRSGLSHVVAVSGMHISFLMGFLMMFTGNRRRLALIAFPTLLGFCGMVGFTPSVCRAAFMQMYLLLAGVWNRENDAPTALAVILAVLLLHNPSAAASVGLQLSFAATAGITIFSGRIYRWMSSGLNSRLPSGRRMRRFMAGVSANAATTFGALLLTTPLMALHFGFVSLVAPVSNLLCLWMISILFVGGYVSVLCAALVPALGALLAWGLDWGTRYVIQIAAWLSGVPGTAVYVQNPIFAIWLLFSYGILIVSFCQRDKSRGYRPIVPLCLVFLLLAADHLLLDITRKEALTLTALDVGQGQCIVLENRRHSVVIDCGSSGSEENPGQIASGYLLSRGWEKLDAAILTHAHQDHISGMARLLSSMDVNLLILPATVDPTDSSVRELLTIAHRRGTEVYWLNKDVQYTLGEMELTLLAYDGKDTDNEKGLGVLATQGDFDALIFGDLPSYAERLLISDVSVPDVEVLVVSHHGSNSSTSRHLLEAVKPDMAIISVGYNLYGHPHPEVLALLNEHHIEIHRTDREGNIRVQG